MKTVERPSGEPSSFLLRRYHELSNRLIHSSIGGIKSVMDAERDERGRFIRRSQSMSRSADPQIPLRAEWWMAI
jgi:hypothetical protein